MSIIVQERFGSREGNGDSYDFLYQAITDNPVDDTEGDMRVAILAEAPEAYEGKLRQGFTDWKQQSNTLWFATVTYADQPVGALEGSIPPTQIVRFSTTGGTQHITQSKETINSYGLSEPPNFKGAIGVDEEGEVAGVDIGAGVFNFTVQLRIKTANIADDFILALQDLAFHFNDSAFTVTLNPDGPSSEDLQLTFAECECLFLGAEAAPGPLSDEWTFDLQFSGSPSRTDLEVGDIVNIEKRGWDYLWVYYKRDTDEASSASPKLVTVPKYVYIERVFDSGDFDRLLIA